jgi:hypothetical protein
MSIENAIFLFQTFIFFKKAPYKCKSLARKILKLANPENIF